MGAKKARHKLARKVIAWHTAMLTDDPCFISDHPSTHPLTDHEFDRLVDEIRAATVTVTWPHKKGRHK